MFISSKFLTAMITQNAPVSDQPGLTQVHAEQQQRGLPAPSALAVDGA